MSPFISWEAKSIIEISKKSKIVKKPNQANALERILGKHMMRVIEICIVLVMNQNIIVHINGPIRITATSC